MAVVVVVDDVLVDQRAILIRGAVQGSYLPPRVLAIDDYGLATATDSLESSVRRWKTLFAWFFLKQAAPKAVSPTRFFP